MKGLVDSLKYYVDGSDEERRVAAIALIEDFKAKRAKEFIEKQFKTQGIETLNKAIQGLKDLKIERQVKQVEETLVKKKSEAKKVDIKKDE